ncbi:MAG: ubiquinone/menaquinone biosynthesis methyltransferase [Anaerolineales bacterium]|nr:ubiquinone/menaquinone biosynthesis methyltransferase [Anaerolineales bacterium]
MSELEKSLESSERGAYVSRMFDRIAPRYDLMNRLMSLGQDQRWRRRMATLAALPPAGWALDLATGTGDVAAALLQRDPSAHVVGADFAVEMMRVGQQKGQNGPITFMAADGLALPFADQSFDAVLHAFLMRNIADIRAGFREQWRVLKPGGTVVCLEIVGPAAGWTRTLYHLFFERIVPQLGKVVSGDRMAYSYLPQSVLRFPDPERLSRLMADEGFIDVRYERLMLGSIAIHSARKAE